jgi:transcriptional regulator with XRE-family HTH domain
MPPTALTSAQIGANLQLYRSSRGLTQKEVADEIGVSRSAYALWEQGIREIAAVDLVRVAAVLKYPAALLLGETTATAAADDQFIRNYAELPEDQRAAVRSVAAAMLGGGAK